MSSKRDWNDMSDSDSDSEGKKHIQESNEQQKQQEIEQVPSLNKIVSSPLPDKRSLNEQQNLLKLENYPKDEVWLYVPLYYKDNVDDVDKILKNEKAIKKIDQFSKGWNILTDRQSARLYIIEGKKQGAFLIKFYFSNKNQEGGNNNHKKYDNYRHDYDSRKVKYIPKSPNGKNDYKKMKQPDFLRRIQSQQQQIGGRTPKSPNYKNQQWKKYDEDSRGYRQKNYNNQNNRQGYNNKRFEGEQGNQFDMQKNNDNKGHRPKYTIKNEASSKNDSEYVPQSPKKKYVQKQQQQPKTEPQIIPSKIQQKPQVIAQKQQPQTNQQKQQPEQNLSSAKSSPNEKKKKKNNRKNHLSKDDNNPFSMLNDI